MRETPIQQVIRRTLGAYPDDIVLWRNNVAKATPFGGTRPIQFGLVNGASDLVGIGYGRFIAIEVKTNTGRLSDAQRRFLRIVQRRGGVAMVARAGTEAEAEAVAMRALDAVRDGRTDWEDWPYV